jgi:hypothetical protein
LVTTDNRNGVRSEISYVVSDFLAKLITTNLHTLALSARRVKLPGTCPLGRHFGRATAFLAAVAENVGAM